MLYPMMCTVSPIGGESDEAVEEPPEDEVVEQPEVEEGVPEDLDEVEWSARKARGGERMQYSIACAVLFETVPESVGNWRSIEAVEEPREDALEDVIEPTEVEGEIHECIIDEESKFEPGLRSLKGRTPTSCVGE